MPDNRYPGNTTLPIILIVLHAIVGLGALANGGYAISVGRPFFAASNFILAVLNVWLIALNVDTVRSARREP